VTVVGDTAVTGFDRRELTRVFKLEEEKQKPLADTQLFARLDTIMGGVIRATRQVPPERALWATPDRDRPFKVFCYHILVDPIHVLDAIAGFGLGLAGARVVYPWTIERLHGRRAAPTAQQG